MSKSKTQFEHLQNKRKTKRERETERDEKIWNKQMYPTFGKTRNNIDNLFNKFMY